MKLTFGDIVIVDEIELGVVIKCWAGEEQVNYDIYVRSYNSISNYKESEVRRYLVRHKYLSEEEIAYQNNAENNI